MRSRLRGRPLEFFERADMLNTPVDCSDSKADPADVARQGYEPMKPARAGWSPAS